MEPIDILITNGKALVWNVDDVLRLRRDHRIVGSLIGCLPRCPNQNKQLGLPLQLMQEEATLLREKGIGRFLSFHRNRDKLEDEVKQFAALRDAQYVEQNELFREERRIHVRETIDLIVDGKRRLLNGELSSKKRKKQLRKKGVIAHETLEAGVSVEVVPPSLDKDEVLRLELERVDSMPPPSRDSVNVQLFLECPWAKSSDFFSAEWQFPKTTAEKMRQRVFVDLWQKGKFLTSGQKFGGDFLVYPGDPMLYHATHVAVCIQNDQRFSGLDVIAKGRLGSNVKKKVLLCSVGGGQNEVSYLTLQWANMN